MVSIGTGPNDPRAWVRAARKLIEAAEAAAPDDKLPAQAQITVELGISPATTRRACRELARLGLIRLIRVALVSGDTAMPAAGDVAANIYRWERGTVSPSDRYRLYYCHVLGIPPDRFGDPSWDPAQDVPRVIITISLPEGTETQLRLTGIETPASTGTGT
jgi:DNA-binding transcriptional MocR family regulator